MWRTNIIDTQTRAAFIVGLIKSIQTNHNYGIMQGRSLLFIFMQFAISKPISMDIVYILF